MKSKHLWLFSLLLLQHPVMAETVYKCKAGTQFAYQSEPCTKGATVETITPKVIKPDLASLQRLEQEHLEFLRQSNPTEYRRLLREKMPPTEQLADERAEERERLQQQQAFQQQQILREIEARRLQEWQLEQDRLALERQRVLQWPYLMIPQQHRPYYQGGRQPFHEGMNPPIESLQPPLRSQDRTIRLEHNDLR